MKKQSTVFRALCRALTVLLVLGEAPAWAATKAPVNAAALETQFRREVAAWGLNAARAEVQHESDLSQVRLLATSPLDLSQSRSLLHERQSVLTPGGRAVASQDSHVRVNREHGRIEVSTRLSLAEGIGDYAGRPELRGFKVEAVLAIPLDQYSQAMNAETKEQGLHALTREVNARQKELYRTTITAPNGETVSFAGDEMTLEQALQKLMPDAAHDAHGMGTAAGPADPHGPVTNKICVCCIRTCLARLGANVSIWQLLCLATAVGRCARVCEVLPPSGVPYGCVACLAAVFSQCSVRVSIDAIRQFARCIRGCF
jgi:hypothetical protein